MSKHKEKRSFGVIWQRGAKEDGQTVLRGYAAVFNQLSDNLGGFRERIEPGAFAKTLRVADIKALWNHNVDYVLGRNKVGTLRLWEDKRGLAFEIFPPPTQWARDAVASIERGDVNQMSFGFAPVRDRWEDEPPQGVIRTLLEVTLFDVSPATFAAYPQTSVAVRSKVSELQRKKMYLKRLQLLDALAWLP